MVMMLVGYGLIVIIVSESAFYEERRGGLWWLDGPARPNASSFHVFHGRETSEPEKLIVKNIIEVLLRQDGVMLNLIICLDRPCR